VEDAHTRRKLRFGPDGASLRLLNLRWTRAFRSRGRAPPRDHYRVRDRGPYLRGCCCDALLHVSDPIRAWGWSCASRRTGSAVVLNAITKLTSPYHQALMSLLRGADGVRWSCNAVVTDDGGGEDRMLAQPCYFSRYRKGCRSQCRCWSRDSDHILHRREKVRRPDKRIGGD
jgi:hypothetical protein